MDGCDLRASLYVFLCGDHTSAPSVVRDAHTHRTRTARERERRIRKKPCRSMTKSQRGKSAPRHTASARGVSPPPGVIAWIYSFQQEGGEQHFHN